MEQVKNKLCKTCSETDPAKFPKDRTAICKRCRSIVSKKRRLLEAEKKRQLQLNRWVKYEISVGPTKLNKPLHPYVIPGITRPTEESLCQEFMALSVKEKIEAIMWIGSRVAYASRIKISGNTRVRSIVAGRHLCFYFMKKYTPLSMEEIGVAVRGVRAYGKPFNHSTISVAITDINTILYAKHRDERMETILCMLIEMENYIKQYPSMPNRMNWARELFSHDNKNHKVLKFPTTIKHTK